LLQPAAKDYLQTWPVSKRVNSSRAMMIRRWLITLTITLCRLTILTR